MEITTAPGAKDDAGGDSAFVAGAGDAKSPKTSTKRSLDAGGAGGWELVGVPAIPSRSPVVAAGFKMVKIHFDCRIPHI